MKTVLLAGAAVALALSAGNASAGAAHPGVSAKNTNPFHYILPHAGAGYSQRDNDNGIGIVSQNFTDSGLTAFFAQGADDFALKKKAKITEVDADGIYFNGPGPADSFDVHFYKDAGGLPGAEIGSGCPGASYTDETGTGTPDIACHAKIKTKGKVWVSVYATMAFGSGGEWGWLTNNTVRNNPAAWQNPGGGFGTPCSTWGVLTSCISAGEGGDFSYAVLGKIK
jgi:hypothetical protein